MPLIQDIEPAARQAVLGDLLRHTEVLREIHKSASDRAQQYILLTNGGAVIATLGFMGASDELRRSRWAWLALALFLAGVIACGFVAAVTYHRSRMDFLGWINDLDAFVAGKIDTNQPAMNINTRNKKIGWLAETIAYVAFAAFIAGVVVSLWHMP